MYIHVHTYVCSFGPHYNWLTILTKILSSILCYTVQKEDQFLCNISLRLIVHIVFLFLHGYGMHYNTRSKRFTKKLYLVLLSRKKTSFCAKFQVHCSHRLPVFTSLWPAL